MTNLIAPLAVPMYGVLVLNYLDLQESPRTLIEICNELSFCICDDDWDINVVSTRSLIKLLLTHRSIFISSNKFATHAYEITATGRHQLAVFNAALVHIDGKAWGRSSLQFSLSATV